MNPNQLYLDKPLEFWSTVQYVSEKLGYSIRQSKTNPDGKLKDYSIDELKKIMSVFSYDDKLLKDVNDYLSFRSSILNNYVKQNLMNRDQAKSEFENLISNYTPSCKLPYNKQKKEKRHLAYLTCIVNVLTELNLNGKSFIDDPNSLIIFTDNNYLTKVLSRRLDGAYPSLVNPNVIWEIKEYYGTTTFGSRVSDGVYETQLDGYELKEYLREKKSTKVKHYLIVDDFYTWWIKGKSYLCRLIDIMHKGLVDEVIFGREVLTRWPSIIKNW